MAAVEVTGDDAVEVGIGDEIVIRLPENATTGYVWTVHAVGDGLELVDDTMVAPEALAPGAGGERLVRVRATAPTRAEVTLRLGRPWEQAPTEERRVSVTVTP